MTSIFLDESGDLGFSKGSSRWFILTIGLTNNYRKAEKCVKKVHRGLKKRFKKVSELHAYHSDSITKKRILSNIADLDDFRIFCVILNKKKVYIDLRKQKNYLYNYTANILLDRLHNKSMVKAVAPIKIIIDQRETNKFLKNNFQQYLENNLIKRGSDNFQVLIRPSESEKCLQAIDFVSWAIFRKYERGDYEYYQIIKDKVIEENLLFP